MAIVDQVSTASLERQFPGLKDLIDELKKVVSAEASKKAWQWYNNNFSRVLFSKKIVFWTVKVTVADCRPLIEELFGKETA